MSVGDAGSSTGPVPARFAPILFGALLSGLMTLIISGIATYRNLGLPPDFLARWLVAYVNAWVLAFPTVLVVGPIVRRLVARLTRPT